MVATEGWMVRHGEAGTLRLHGLLIARRIGWQLGVKASVAGDVGAVPAAVAATVATSDEKRAGQRAILVEDVVLGHLLVYHVPYLWSCSRNILLHRNMSRILITEKELMSQLRLQGVNDVSEVKLAAIEPDGRISVIKQEQSASTGAREKRVG